MSQLVELDPILVKPLSAEVPRRRERETHNAPLDPMLVSPLRRPDPHKTLPRRRASTTQARPKMLRAAAILVGATALIAFTGRVATFASAPVVATHETGLQIRTLEQELSKERLVNAQLERDIAYLGTRAGIEQEARRRGWVHKGEIAITLVAPEGSQPEAVPAKPEVQVASAAGDTSISSQIRRAVDTCLAVLGNRSRGQ
jgi:hypothetical protein